jgi:hypothetical protein
MKAGVILVGPSGWAALRDGLEAVGRYTALGYHKRWWNGVRFFHSDGFVYEIESATPERPLGAVSKFLAMTVYNPSLQFRYSYRRLGEYALEELRNAVGAAIREDDDILTQFEEEDELLRRLAAADSFQAVAAVVRHGTVG